MSAVLSMWSNRNQQGNASMHAAIFRFFFYFSA
ncbi:pheST operon leader peptide PheM [Serratia rhizosphaerae]|uniref:pheST attenuator peptide n=1 Tax=Serratia rhizosphaerae TaxID=2597702 RepID=A0ABX6GTX5_9GAMM|nr:pheST operon leader peptide PheM [Serratia rhizosphaerae]